LLGAVAALPLALLPVDVASANNGGGGGSGAAITIQKTAQYLNAGSQVIVGLDIRCMGGSGSVGVNLSQAPPETPYPVTGGGGTNTVVCDGKTHSVGVSFTGFGYDVGKAYAQAGVMVGLNAAASTSRTIKIVAA
jgi:hypothetical protein